MKNTSVMDIIQVVQKLLEVHGYELSLGDDLVAMTVLVNDHYLILPIKDITQGVVKYAPEILAYMVYNSILNMIANFIAQTNN